MIFINSSSKEELKIFQPFKRTTITIGIGCLLAIFEREGIKARFVDEQVEKNEFEKIAEYVKDMEPPYIFGFSILTAGFKSALSVSKQLKGLYPDSIICFGGIHPTALPDESLAYDHVDYVLRADILQ